MKRALGVFSVIFGSVCILIGIAHILVGPQIIPGGVPVNATMDSEDRFYATLFAGFGIAVIWSGRDLSERRNIFAFLMAVFFAGGVARLISAGAVGWPAPFFVVLTAIELLVPIICWFWIRAIDKD